MKLVISNADEALCFECGEIGGPPKCPKCGGELFIDKRGKRFEPVYAPAATFRASPYTPLVGCRRVAQRPIKVERRKSHDSSRIS